MESLAPGLQSNLKAVCTAVIPNPAPPSCRSSLWLPAMLGTLPFLLWALQMPSSLLAPTYPSSFWWLWPGTSRTCPARLPLLLSTHAAHPSSLPKTDTLLLASYHEVLASGKEKTRHKLVFVCCKKRHLRTAVTHSLPAKIRLKPPIRMACLSSGITEHCSPCFCLTENAVITPLSPIPTNIY